MGRALLTDDEGNIMRLVRTTPNITAQYDARYCDNGKDNYMYEFEYVGIGKLNTGGHVCTPRLGFRNIPPCILDCWFLLPKSMFYCILLAKMCKIEI